MDGAADSGVAAGAAVDVGAVAGSSAVWVSGVDLSVSGWVEDSLGFEEGSVVESLVSEGVDSLALLGVSVVPLDDPSSDW